MKKVFMTLFLGLTCNVSYFSMNLIAQDKLTIFMDIEEGTQIEYSIEHKRTLSQKQWDPVSEKAPITFKEIFKIAHNKLKSDFPKESKDWSLFIVTFRPIDIRFPNRWYCIVEFNKGMEIDKWWKYKKKYLVLFDGTLIKGKKKEK